MKQQAIASILVINITAAILVLPVLPVMAASQIVSQRPASAAISAVGGGSSYSPIVTPGGRFVLFAGTSANLVVEPGGGPMLEAAPANIVSNIPGESKRLPFSIASVKGT